MKKMMWIILIGISVLLVSCYSEKISSSSPSPLELTKPLATETLFAPSVPEWYRSVISTPVIQGRWESLANETAVSEWSSIVEKSINQTTDGELVLYAKKVDPACHDKTLSQSYNVQFAFLNTSDAPLILPGRFHVTISGMITSDINPLYFTQNGERVYLPSWFITDTAVNPPPPISIPPQEVYETILEIPLPKSLTGNYYVKFVFVSVFETIGRFANIWNGSISSNVISLCIIE